MPDVSTLLAPTLATDEDDRALSELARSVPMRGSISYVIEREPSFLAMTRAQGRGGQVICIKEPSGRVVATALGAKADVFLNGRPTPVLYAGDVKVHGDYRNLGIAGGVLQGTMASFPELGLAFASVLRSNDAVARLVSRSAGFLQCHPIADVENFTVFFGRPRAETPYVRRATKDDARAMAELFMRVHAGRQLAPVLDLERAEAALTPWPSFRIEDYLVLERAGRIVAFAGVWDAFDVKQVRLLSLSPALRLVRAGYNAFARLRSRPVLPADGEHLRFLYVTFPCAEDPADLAEVLRAIEAEHGQGAHVYFDIAFDVTDPLREALKGFAKTRVAFRIALFTWGEQLGRPPSLDARPVYFDAALV